MTVSSVSIARGFQAEPGRRITNRAHERSRGRGEEAAFAEFLTPVLGDFANPGLFAANVDVMATRFQSGFNDSRSVIDEWTGSVANNFGALEDTR